MERTYPAVVSGPVDLPTLLHSRYVVLRPLRVGNVGRVAEIQAEPGVACWWGTPDKEELRRQAQGRDEEKAFAIERKGELVGLIQYHEENEPDFRHAGIDIFLAERAQGSGLGPDAVRRLARYLVHEWGHHRLTIDPAADNAAAIRAYEKLARIRDALDIVAREGLSCVLKCKALGREPPSCLPLGKPFLPVDLQSLNLA